LEAASAGKLEGYVKPSYRGAWDPHQPAGAKRDTTTPATNQTAKRNP